MGTVVHFEIHASDPQALISFYEQAAGWTFNAMPEFEYWTIDTGEGPGINGGLTRRQGPSPAEGAPVMGATIVLDAADIDAAIDRISAAGGTTALPKMAIPGVGWAAYFKDPDGNVFGVFQDDTNATMPENGGDE